MRNFLANTYFHHDDNKHSGVDMHRFILSNAGSRKTRRVSR